MNEMLSQIMKIGGIFIGAVIVIYVYFRIEDWINLAIEKIKKRWKRRKNRK